MTTGRGCGASAILPGQGAGWAEASLWDLWLGRGGAGEVHAGCPNKAIVVGSGLQQVVYQAGYRDGQLTSVGIDSRHGGPALILGTPAVLALAQLSAGRPIASTPRLELNGGDGYLIWTLDGTYAFLRADSAAPYVELPPPVTLVWAHYVEKAHRWLWPVSVPARAGFQNFNLVPLPGVSSAMASIIYDQSDGTAMSAQATVSTTQAAESYLSWSSLAAFAPAG